jgi:hypothetical protein
MNDHTKPTTYFQMAREREQQLELDATADGHDAFRLQAKRSVPTYPHQPASSPWASDPVPAERPTGERINAVPDLTKVQRGNV